MSGIDNQPDTAIGERLKIVIQKVAKSNTRQFSINYNINEAQLGRIIKGKEGLSAKRAIEISSIFNINLNWLFTGDGAMLNEKSGLERPDQDIVIKVKQSEWDALQISFGKLAQSVVLPDQIQQVANEFDPHESLLDKKRAASKKVDIARQEGTKGK